MAKHNPVTGVRVSETKRQHCYEPPQGNMGQHGADRATHDDEAAQADLRNREHEFHGGATETSGTGEPPHRGQFGELAGQGVPNAGDQKTPLPLGGNLVPPQLHSPAATEESQRHHADKGGIDYQRERPDDEPARPERDKISRRTNSAEKKSRKRTH